MAFLQTVRTQITICTQLRKCLWLPKQSFSFSMQLPARRRKVQVQPPLYKKIETRFARVEQGLEENRKTAASFSESEDTAACRAVSFDPNLVSSLLGNMANDQPVSDMPDPFVKDYFRCYLCTSDVRIDYKNVRLLSQFVSPYTGRIYGRAITGLCIPMQKHVASMIKRSRSTGFMPVITKDPKYLKDPQPFNPMGKQRQ